MMNRSTQKVKLHEVRSYHHHLNWSVINHTTVKLVEENLNQLQMIFAEGSREKEDKCQCTSPPFSPLICTNLSIWFLFECLFQFFPQDVSSWILSHHFFSYCLEFSFN